MHFWMPNAKLATLRPLHLTQASQVLDVGCGAGHLLHSLRELGFYNLLGIDPFNQADIAYPNGLRVEKRDIFSEQGQWDAVMFHHSFEHLPNQRTNLGQAFNILKPGGMALVRIPTVSSYVWQEYGVNWVRAIGCATPSVPTFGEKYAGIGRTGRLHHRKGRVRLECAAILGQQAIRARYSAA